MCVSVRGTWRRGWYLDKHTLYNSISVLLYKRCGIEDEGNTTETQCCPTVSDHPHTPPSPKQINLHSQGHPGTHAMYTQQHTRSVIFKGTQGGVADVTTALMSSPEWVTLAPGERSGVAMEMRRRRVLVMVSCRCFGARLKTCILF